MDVPNAETRTHPDQKTGADVFDVPDASLSPTDPDRLVMWVLGLPAGAILLDKLGDAWQLRQTTGGQPYIRCVAGDKGYYLGSDCRVREMGEWAPFRLIWSSVGFEGTLHSVGNLKGESKAAP